MEERVLKGTKEKINEIMEDGITPNNLEYLDKLVDIYKDIKEVECMYYGNYGDSYGRRPGYDSYGREHYGDYDHYGRRGYDKKYRGHEHLDRMYDDYGRYEGNRERYGANEDTKRSLKHMLESMEDFARMLREEAQSQEEVEMIRQTAQRIAQM